jgi:hypothetical protein
MRFKGQLPGEAARGFSVMSAEVSCTGYFQGRRTWKGVETANQARITSTSDPSISRGIDGQEEEQAA